MELELNPALIYLASVIRKALETVPHDANAQATAEYVAATLLADGWDNPEPAAEPSREDLYEAAVRAILDLCDGAEDDTSDERPVPSVVAVADVRKAIKEALLMGQEEAQ